MLVCHIAVAGFYGLQTDLAWKGTSWLEKTTNFLLLWLIFFACTTPGSNSRGMVLTISCFLLGHSLSMSNWNFWSVQVGKDMPPKGGNCLVFFASKEIHSRFEIRDDRVMFIKRQDLGCKAGQWFWSIPGHPIFGVSLGQDCKAEKNGKACRRKKKDLKKDPSWWVRGGGYWTAHFLIGQLDIGAADSLVFFLDSKLGMGQVTFDEFHGSFRFEWGGYWGYQ